MVTVEVPWAEPRSRFTANFESMVISLLAETSVEAVRRLTGVSWNAIDGIKKRAVRRGLDRRGQLGCRATINIILNSE